MLSEISNTALHKRLIVKGFVNSGLSTFSTQERKALIQKYIKEHIDTNQSLKDKITELESELNQNTATLLEIANQVKMRTDIELDDLLVPYLIPDFKAKTSLKIL